MKQRNILTTAIALLLFTPLMAQVSTGAGSTSVAPNSNTANPRLGIGTTNPDYPLHIRCGEYNGTTQGMNATYPNNGILIQKDNGTSGATLYLEYMLGSGRRWAVTSGGTGNSGVGNFIVSDMNAAQDRLVIEGGTGEVGIGVTNPTAQLHTTSTVRFQGLTSSASLTDVLVRDANGNVFYRDASTLFSGGGGSGSGWLLTGNAIGGTEFLGTTNNNDLRFRTNNTQKMVLTSAGQLGIGTATPVNAAEIFFADDPIVGNNGLLLSNSGTHAATLLLANTNTGGRRWAIASTGSSNGGAGNLAIADITGAFNAAVIEGGTGNFGINVNNPDAKLHVDGSVRFENLPSGSGNVLVIDGNGDVKVAQSIAYRNSEYEQQINDLKDQVAFLFKELTQRCQQSGKPIAYLEQNAPNPFSSSTVIRYYLPSVFPSAELRITNLAGQTVKTISVPGRGYNSITIAANELSSGIYMYSLVAGNQVLDSKKMLLTR
jgi:hypothetical protein